MLYSVYSAYSFLGIECINILQINIDKTRKNTLKRYMKKVLFIFKVRSMWVRKRDYWKPCSVNQLSHSVVSNSLQPHELQHARLPCPSPTLELVQTHVHWVSDAIQPSSPLLCPSPPVFNLSQHQGLFQWVGSSHQVAKVLEFQLQHQPFQWIFRTDFL